MTSFSPIEGLKGFAEWTVGPEHLAEAIGNPGVPVLATPMLLDLMEIAADNALKPVIPNDWITLGIAADLKHFRPTPEGVHVRAEATVIAIDRQKIDFHVQVYDEVELVGEARHSRFCLAKSDLDQRISAKIRRRDDRWETEPDNAATPPS